MLITGRLHFPYETSQRPLFNTLGTPAEQKLHVVQDVGGHSPRRTDIASHILDWLDRWFGPSSNSRLFLVFPLHTRATDVIAAIASGEVSASEVVRAHLDQIDRLQPAERVRRRGAARRRSPKRAARHGKERHRRRRQHVFAFKIGVNPRTPERWEQGRSKPNEQAAALIWLVRKSPDTLKRLESLAAPA